MQIARCLALVPLSALLVSCGGGGGGSSSMPVVPSPVTYTATKGVAQKGPLIKGSTVTAQELDANLSPGGKQYSYQVTSDLGTFSPTSTFTSQYIGLNATGYYFDEVANAVSTGTIALNGYSDLTVDSVLNVNLLTTLAYQRIQHLVTSSKMTFAAARSQAEGEVLAALNIPAGSSGSFSALDLGGTTDGDHILAAISSIFVYGNSSGPLSSLIANFQSDIGTNGVITTAATKSALRSAAKALNPTAVAANLTQAYSAAGMTFTAANITDWLDQDGDGVIGKFKFQVADATPSSVFTFPASVVNQVAGTNVSATGGKLFVNQTQVPGVVTVQKGDTVTVSPGAGAFPNGVLNIYLESGATNTARVSFISGLVSIAVTPSTASVAKGLTQQFRATGTFSDTSSSDITGGVGWITDAPAVATVSATTGLATAAGPGSTMVTAGSGTVSGSATLTVTQAVVESFSIAPSSPIVGVGLNTQLTANGLYSDGTSADITNIANWTSGNTSLATVGPTTGLTAGVATGSVTITARVGPVTQSSSLTILGNTWSAAGGLAYPCYAHTATLLPSGKVLVTGGIEIGNGALDNTEIYDPSNDTWALAAFMAATRAYHTASLLPNGKVLVAGGYNAGLPTISAEVYDPTENSWSAAGAMALGRAEHTATLLSNGKILVAGGTVVDGFGNPVETATAELYDSVANSWSSAGSMTSARGGHTATLLSSGKVLVAGGYSASAEIYDPVANTWSPAGSMSNSRAYHTATLLPNGKVLVTGGAGASAELYDPATNTWSPAASMSVPRFSHSASLLQNGKVLVAGGDSTGGAILASAELYDPASNAWTSAGSLATARMRHTATLLVNGVVLAAGGEAGALGSAELYW